MWSIKGRYSNAIAENDPVSWDASIDGKLSVSILAVSLFNVFDDFYLSIIFVGGFATE